MKTVVLTVNQSLWSSNLGTAKVRLLGMAKVTYAARINKELIA